jgi:hypothetical protein
VISHGVTVALTHTGGLDIEEFMSIMSHALRMEAGEHVYGESIEKQAATQTVGKVGQQAQC